MILLVLLQRRGIKYVRATSIMNGKSDVIIDEELESHMTVSLKELNFLIIFVTLFNKIALYTLGRSRFMLEHSFY